MLAFRIIGNVAHHRQTMIRAAGDEMSRGSEGDRCSASVSAFVLALSLALPSTPGAAANFDVAKDTHGQQLEELYVKLSGEVTTGDLSKLKNILAGFDTEGRNEYDGRVQLYLDSPGGSYSEGLAVADYVRKEGISTRVTSDAVCLSACAIIFMHGVARDPDETAYLDRKIEIGARVGFHAPYLILPPELQLTGDEARLAIAYAYSDALSAFSKLLESGDKVLDSELLIKMLRTPPNQMTYVETYGDLLKWKIGLSDAPKITSLKYEQIVLACENAWAQEQGQRGTSSLTDIRTNKYRTNPKLYKRLRGGGEWYQFVTEDYSGATCNLKITQDVGQLDVRLLGFSYGEENLPLDSTPGQVLTYEYINEPAEKIAIAKNN
ncbi:ATP-dependent Clp protease proteolytic subunit [Mesorhizobium sp. PAMC28654]|uniref:ATP-dependent Clp protease proteolytic subunit n=1 Tax=Mesorhizobium sp. PAMC28654 TaxID=2880934 RepID=UPI001D0AFB75|nr:ATP-dependent Clp protease proteolytic subunit [Mesorhizobium sp. PAMC28654]UDL87985.1 ATP-dependent Clp protease proteolytic subunit [Mesorhizobium sp. PAMC28654]